MFVIKDLNEEECKQLVTFLDNWWKYITINSNWGEFVHSQFILNIIKNYDVKFFVVRCYSAAFTLCRWLKDLWMDVTILDWASGMVHVTRINSRVFINKEGNIQIVKTDIDEDLSILWQFEDIKGLTFKERRIYEEGGDVFLDTIRLRELLD